MKTKIKFIPFLLVCLMIMSVFAGCGGGPAKDIVGTWVSSSGSAQCCFYEDGKCEFPWEISGSNYGEETYVVDSNNMLKVTNYYGSALTFKYVSLDKVEEYEASASGSSNYQPWWCIDGNKLYINSKNDYFTKQ